MVGPDDADDCFQETFIAALRGYDRMDGRHPRAWVMTIARRKAIDHHRARARRPEPREHLPETAVAADGPAGSGISTARCGRPSPALPGRQRTAVALRYAGRPRLPRDRHRARVQRGGGPPPGGRRPAALRQKIDREETTR